MFRKLSSSILGLALISALAPVAAGDVRDQSETGVSTELIAQANPQIPRATVMALPPSVRASHVVIDPSVTADTPIVYPDGSPVPGQSAAKLAVAAAGCGALSFVRGVATSPCAVFGSPGLRMTYTWNSNIAAPPPAGCVAGEGHDDVGNLKWLSVGCGTSGRGTIPWGNNLAKPRIKATSGNATFRGGWSHSSVSSSSKCVTEIYVSPPSITKNAGRVKCPNVFTSMRAKVVAGSTTRYGAYVGPNAWSKYVFSPGQTVKSVSPVK